MAEDRNSSDSSIGCGCLPTIMIVIAALMSYSLFHSVGWAVVAGFFNLPYIIYFLIRYGWPNLG